MNNDVITPISTITTDDDSAAKDAQFAESVTNLARKVEQRVHELEASQGLVDIDVLRTIKAIFYEEVMELVRKRGG